MPQGPLLPELLKAADGGDPLARDRLFTVLYDDLRRVARRELRHGAGPLISLSATTVVHEAWEALAAREGLAFPDSNRFMAYMARAMRGLIVDAARERNALKRGGAFHITQLDTGKAEDAPQATDLQRLSGALDALAVVDPRLAEIVDLKYFCGFTFGDIAALRGVSERTIQRDWDKARLLLFSELGDAT